jgi:uncharacterized membrane protein
MVSTRADELVARYLDDLARRLRDGPRDRREELLEDVRAHIAEALSSVDSSNEAEIRSLLDRVGDPAVIAAEARERSEVQPARPGALEVVALVMLAIGGLVIPVLGWIVGVLLLWLSNVWTRRDKVIGTLLPPGGLALPIFLGFLAAPVSFGPLEGAVLGITLFLAPIATLIYLATRLRGRSTPAPV